MVSIGFKCRTGFFKIDSGQIGTTTVVSNELNMSTWKASDLAMPTLSSAPAGLFDARSDPKPAGGAALIALHTKP